MKPGAIIVTVAAALATASCGIVVEPVYEHDYDETHAWLTEHFEPVLLNDQGLHRDWCVVFETEPAEGVDTVYEMAEEGYDAMLSKSAISDWFRQRCFFD